MEKISGKRGRGKDFLTPRDEHYLSWFSLVSLKDKGLVERYGLVLILLSPFPNTVQSVHEMISLGYLNDNSMFYVTRARRLGRNRRLKKLTNPYF